MKNHPQDKSHIAPYAEDAMSSQRRIDASRANGAKSSGPTTPEGKARSAQNGIRHGILSETLVLEEESADRFQSLFHSFQQIFTPVDEFEAVCVETMIAARWRCLRVWTMETAGLQRQMNAQPDEGLSARTRAAIAFQSQGEGLNIPDLLGRYETRYDRQFSRAYGLLLKYRRSNPPPADPAPNPENQILPSEPNPKTGHSQPTPPTAEQPAPASPVVANQERGQSASRQRHAKLGNRRPIERRRRSKRNIGALCQQLCLRKVRITAAIK